MLDKNTSDRIAKEAENLYPYASVNFETFTGRNDLQKAKSVAYISGAEKEAERAQGLVDCLKEVRKYFPDPTNYARIIDNTLTKYNNSK